MKKCLLLILFTSFRLLACLPIDVEKNLISHHGYISFQVSGLKQHSLDNVILFINKVATKTNRNPFDVIDILKEMHVPSGVITKESLESAIVRSLGTYDPSRVVKLRSLKGYRKLTRQHGELIDYLSPQFVEAYLKGEIKNGAKYIKLFAKADPMLARVMSDFVLSNKALVSDKVFLGIIDEAIKKNLSPHDFITLVTPARLKEINQSAVRRLGVESLRGNTEYQNLVSEIRNLEVSQRGPLRIQTVVKIKNAEGVIPEYTIKHTSPGYFTGQTYPGYRAGTRQVYHFDIPHMPHHQVDPLVNVTWRPDGEIERVLWAEATTGEMLIQHSLVTPERWIHLVGEEVTDQFFGMRKVGNRTYAFANAEELNANIRAFNKVVGEGSPMSIDSHFYYSAPLQGENPLALSSQRTIDRLADGFGWPVGSRDVYQVHDLGTHSSMMLADKRLIKLSQEKAKDVINARKVINELDIPQGLKDEIIFSLNTEAGEIFEGVGVSMNYIIERNWDAGAITSAKSSQRAFFQEILSDSFKAKLHQKSPVALEALESYMRSLPDQPLGLNNYQLLEMANRKLQVMRAMTRN